MWPYWILFLIPAIAALGGLRPQSYPTPVRQKPSTPALLGMGALLTLFIGYRYQVGGDWLTYSENFETLRGLTLSETLQESDPGYQLISWISLEAGWGVFGVNLISGVIFVIGLLTFCRGLPRPWLAVAVAIPYMVIVVAMGYSRQGVALGFAMLALTALRRRSIRGFVIYVLLGATFHKTAVLLLPTAALVSSRSRVATLTWVGVVSVSAYLVLLSESVEDLYVNYVQAQYQSEGALIRLLMNAVPAIVLLRWRKRFRFDEVEGKLWRVFAYVSLLLLVILFVTNASTAVDRIGLYLLPLQLAVFAHLPTLLGPKGDRNVQWEGVVLTYYAVVLFVWLNFATHSKYWLPYRFFPVEGAF